jgi:hypothetical protein
MRNADEKVEGSVYRCDVGHWYVQNVGYGPGSWSLPFVGCPVCKIDELQTQLKNAQAGVWSLQGSLNRG